MGRKRKHTSNAARQRAYRQRLKLNRNDNVTQPRFMFARTILSLFDYSGVWSQPYTDAGYNVVRVDLKSGENVILFEKPGYQVHGILAAPPCTQFAASGARWWFDKGNEAIIEGLQTVDATMRIIMVCKPKWWAIENPVGRLNRWLGEPAMYFDPCDYGDPYTKHTALWGEFNTDLPLEVVYPVEGSKMWLNYGGKSEATKEARSVTPEGFARAFFLANP